MTYNHKYILEPRNIVIPILLIIASSLSLTASVVDSSYAIVQEIVIEGNKKTKERAILRELEFSAGDTLWHHNITETIERNRQYVFNTSLFQEVNINIKDWNFDDHTLRIEITVREDLYFYPIPIFSLADRNLNVWLNEFNASFKRVNYGMRFYHFNATGNNDRLRLITQFGYGKRFQLSYNRPYINKAQTLGWKNSIRYDNVKEVNYATEGSKQLFFNNNDANQLETFRLESTLTFRPKITTWHTLKVEYFNNKVSDEVAIDINPNFFLNGANRQSFVEVEYAFTKDNRNLRVYATKGSNFRARLIKRGLGVFDDLDQLELNLNYAKYFELNPKWSLEFWNAIKYSFSRSQQPYYNIKGLGYQNNVVRGYELYVVEALDFVVFKSSIRRALFNANIELGKLMPIPNFKLLPLSVFLTMNADVGYANDPFYAEGNLLPNKALFGYGLGLDMMFYNDFVFQLEYNINHLRDDSFVIRTKLPF